MPKRKRSFSVNRGGSAKKRFRGAPLAIGQMARSTQRSRARLARRNLATMGFLGIERKFYDTMLVSTAITANANAQSGEYDPSATSMITTPTLGAGEQQRDGKQIACLYIDFAFTISCAPVEASADLPLGTNVYIALVLDTQSNGAQMNSEDCFKNLTASVAGSTSPLRNLLFGNRFRILKSRLVEFNVQSATQQAANDYSWPGLKKSYKWYVPLKGLKINFNAGTDASIANVMDNSVHVIAYTNSVTLTPLLTYNARFRFIG